MQKLIKVPIQISETWHWSSIEKEDNIGPKELIDSFKKVQHIFEIVKIHANREMKRLEKGTDNSVLTKERIKSENFRKFQFSSNSAQDVRRRGKPETSRNIVFLENIQLLLYRIYIAPICLRFYLTFKACQSKNGQSFC